MDFWPFATWALRIYILVTHQRFATPSTTTYCIARPNQSPTQKPVLSHSMDAQNNIDDESDVIEVHRTQAPYIDAREDSVVWAARHIWLNLANKHVSREKISRATSATSAPIESYQYVTKPNTQKDFDFYVRGARQENANLSRYYQWPRDIEAFDVYILVDYPLPTTVNEIIRDQENAEGVTTGVTNDTKGSAQGHVAQRILPSITNSWQPPSGVRPSTDHSPNNELTLSTTNMSLSPFSPPNNNTVLSTLASSAHQTTRSTSDKRPHQQTTSSPKNNKKLPH